MSSVTVLEKKDQSPLDLQFRPRAKVADGHRLNPR